MSKKPNKGYKKCSIDYIVGCRCNRYAIRCHYDIKRLYPGEEIPNFSKSDNVFHLVSYTLFTYIDSPILIY